MHIKRTLGIGLIFAMILVPAAIPAQTRHPVPREHPRLLGSLDYLQELARQRPEAYARTVEVAHRRAADNHAKMVSLALISAIEQDAQLGRQAVDMAMKYVSGPIRRGHVTFGSDLALSALVYDLCHTHWTEAERRAFHDYVDKTVDANVNSETHVFHNGWYAYKNWGIGLAAYAGYYENPRAAGMLHNLEEEFRKRAAPALELAGSGGGWAEGYYIHYWLYEWLFFCEVARRCEGVDYYAMAPQFFSSRAIASIFEALPGIGEYDSRRSVSMGDGGGRVFGGDRDKALAARRILVNYFRDDPAHHAVHAFNETTPRSSVGNYAYKDFLWRHTSAPKGDLPAFKLSHYSPGPGHVHARSSWEEDATYFFFKASDRFTAHQHLDVGHFAIYRGAELAGDGGHYDDFNSDHAVNYYLRTIAHSTLLVRDPAETWPGIRAGEVKGNDGGQRHDWPHHNGAVADADTWQKDARLYDIADITAFEDFGDYLYVAADGTRAYAPEKVKRFTRQIIFVRPGTFAILDRVETTRPEFKKTWLLQAMKRPERRGSHLVIANGEGRLFVQTLLPRARETRLVDGDDLYSYDGASYAPQRDTGPAPECRIEVAPTVPAAADIFLHVLTATDAATAALPPASAEIVDDRVVVAIGPTRIVFPAERAARVEVGTAVLEEGSTPAPRAFQLRQNYPNPFNSSTAIHFSLATDTAVELTLYDLQGRPVAILLDERRAAGEHVVRWNGRDNAGVAATSGVYLCRLRANSHTATRKLLVLR